jgi:acyl-CoA thioesterase FadM
MKTILNTIFDIKVTVHFEFILKIQRVNQAYYLKTLKRLRESVLKNKNCFKETKISGY